MNNLFVLIGASGSGKSTVAEAITSNICCADDYFINPSTKEYEFDGSKLNAAHDECKESARKMMEAGLETVVIANTNALPWQYADYETMAHTYGYRVHHLVVQNRHGGENIHSVPAEVVIRQKESILNTIKL